MLVPVMDVGVMGMLVREHLVPMRMHVRLFSVPGKVVLMVVVFIVTVPVRVFHHLVCVLVLVTLADVKPNAERHERSRCPELRLGDLRPERE